MVYRTSWRFPTKGCNIHQVPRNHVHFLCCLIPAAHPSTRATIKHTTGCRGMPPSNSSPRLSAAFWHMHNTAILPGLLRDAGTQRVLVLSTTDAIEIGSRAPRPTLVMARRPYSAGSPPTTYPSAFVYRVQHSQHVYLCEKQQINANYIF